MKSLVILLLFSCGSLIAATNIDFFANGRSNIFAPLNERTRSIIYTGFTKFVDDLMNKTSKLSWPEKYRLFSEINHSNHDIDDNYYPDLNLVKTIYSLPKYMWDDEVQEFIDMITDREILFKLGLEYVKEAQTTSIDDVNKIKYKKYLEKIRKINGIYDSKLVEFMKFDIFKVKHYVYLYDGFLANECRVRQSEQQMVANYWGHVNIALFHDYFIIYFSYELAKVIKVSNIDLWEYEFQWYTENFLRRQNPSYFFKSINHMIQDKGLEVKKCNSVNYIEDVTYTRLDAAQGNNSHGETLFNLEPVFSNFDNNSVITGARLIKKNNVIYIQIQEGHLLPNGFVEDVHWIPIKEMKFDEERDKPSYKLRSIDLTDVMVPITNNQNRNRNKNMNLKQVLIGVGFNRNYINRNNRIEERINLKIYSVPMNFTSGKLITQTKGSTKNPWVATGSSHPSEKLTLLKFTNLREPISSTKDNIPDSKNDQYLIFTRTNSEKYDEIIVPYIDIQPVETMPSPLSGIGLYHKGNNDTSGFLALKLHTFNTTPFLKF